MGVTICDARTGSRIGLIRAVLRFALRAIFGWLSLILVLVTKKHQALHDLACRTSVVLLSPESLPETEKFTERMRRNYIVCIDNLWVNVLSEFGSDWSVKSPSNKLLHWPPGDSPHVFCHTSCTVIMLVSHEVRKSPGARELNR